jgi:branched-chain amino acid transport system permease protein
MVQGITALRRLLLSDYDRWLQLLVTGITMGCVYAVIALGFAIVYRSSRGVNLAQGSFAMVGGLLAFSFLEGAGLAYWLAAILSVVVVAVIALLAWRFVLTRVLKESLIAVTLVTAALALLLENLSLLKYGADPKSLPAFGGGRSFHAGGVIITAHSVYIVGILAAMLIVLAVLSRTTLGKRMIAAAGNPTAARLSGVNVVLMVSLSFMISAALGAVGGIAVTAYVGGMTYTSGALYGMMGFIAGVLGGWGSASGAVVGGLALGVVQSLLTRVVPSQYGAAVAFVVLLLVLYLRPQGLLGKSVPEGEI